jgi:hypothetical protein
MLGSLAADTFTEMKILEAGLLADSSFVTKQVLKQRAFRNELQVLSAGFLHLLKCIAVECLGTPPSWPQTAAYAP